MTAPEGIRSFDLVFDETPSLAPERIASLTAWRSVLHRLGLVGVDPARYGGVGFGNVSARFAPGDDRFIVSGSQTGAAPALDAAGYSLVTECDAERNFIRACGPVVPSSESLTHGVLYRLDPGIGAVFHVHSPDLWRAARALGLPVTAAHAAYGTAALAAEIVRLHREGALAHAGAFAMGGHEDGIVVFGDGPAGAGARMAALLVACGTIPMHKVDELLKDLALS